MLDATTLLLCEQTVGRLIILFDVLVFFYYFVIVQLRPDCQVCHQKVPTVVLPCGRCRYCPDCLNQCVTNRCQNRALWPINCCNVEQLPLRFVKHALTEDTIKLVERRVGGWGGLGGEKLYCANSSCLIPLPQTQTPWVRCGECGLRTCRACRNFAHVGSCRTDIGVLT
jgi:hypothetical protein